MNMVNMKNINEYGMNMVNMKNINEYGKYEEHQ